MTLYRGIPIDTKCRQGDSDPPVAIIALSDGCLVFPEDREQVLCLHHAMKITPRGSAELVAYDPAVKEILNRRWVIE